MKKTETKNKALFIARRFPPSVGGMERFAYDLSEALKARVTLRSITWGGSNKWLPVVLPGFFFRGLWVLLTDKSIEIIHMQDAVQAPIGWVLSKLSGKPYIVVAHGLDITFEKAFYQKLILPFVRRADAVVSISTATNDEVVKRGVDSLKTRVVTLGTHDDYKSDVVPNRDVLSRAIAIDLQGRLVLLTTGRLVKRKGVAWFISTVLPNVVKTHPGVLYLVAGEGSEREAIERAIVDSKMENNVTLLGKVSDDVRSLLYQSCDIFIMPNIVVPGDMEGFGIVVHEAATAELPVVASDLEGIKDALTHDKNGILVRSRDADGFLAAIFDFANDPVLRKSFGRNAREFTLREFSWDRIAEKYQTVYSSILKKD